VFVTLAAIYSFIHLYITMVPGKLSCVWRVNCVNENTSRGVTSSEAFPIQNPFNTTIMLYEFRVQILLLIIFNAIATSGYEYFAVNGIRCHCGKSNHCATKLSDIGDDVGITEKEHALDEKLVHGCVPHSNKHDTGGDRHNQVNM
jgi:hypothetical protein